MAAGAALRGAETRGADDCGGHGQYSQRSTELILIYGRFGLPALGVIGSAISTVVAQWTGAVLALWILTSNDPYWDRLRDPGGSTVRRSPGSRIGLPASGSPLPGKRHRWCSPSVTSFGTEALAALE